jgi:hypothetical protein
MTTPDLDTTTTAPATVTTTPQERVGALLKAIGDLKDDDLIEVFKFDGVVEEKGRRYLDALARRIAARAARGISAGRAIDRIWRAILDDIFQSAKRVNGEPSR